MKRNKITFDELVFVKDPFSKENNKCALFLFYSQSVFIRETSNKDIFDIDIFIKGYCTNIIEGLTKEEVELNLNKIKDSESW